MLTEKQFIEKKKNGDFNIKLICGWKAFSKMKKCFMCKKKFPNGITQKRPNELFPYSSYCMYTPKFLVHLQTTHGLEPMDLDMIQRKWLEE